VTAERIRGAVALAAIVAMVGCGNGAETEAETSGATAEPVRPKAEAEPPAPSRCPPGVPACRTAEGRIVFVERVDPDGDGDAHFVIADPQGISLPGITAIDVRRGLRPDPLPEVGERISAAGPVQTGSYGQSQIHAIELHVAGE
jgi:hypothetical protein